MTTVYPKRTFRPTRENQLHFQFAERLKVNVSEVLNEICAAHFRKALERRARTMAKLVSLPSRLQSRGNGKPLSRRTSRR